MTTPGASRLRTALWVADGLVLAAAALAGIALLLQHGASGPAILVAVLAAGGGAGTWAGRRERGRPGRR